MSYFKFFEGMDSAFQETVAPFCKPFDREEVTSSKCGGQYVYLGIEAGITDILSRNPSLIEKHAKVDLMINFDGLLLFKSSTSQF
jgi:hypothetical protein